MKNNIKISDYINHKDLKFFFKDCFQYQEVFLVKI